MQSARGRECVAPGQTYASFHCTNPNAAWRNNCSSGRGFAGALSLTGSLQPGTRHFNQLPLCIRPPRSLRTQPHPYKKTPGFYLFSTHVVVSVMSSHLDAPCSLIISAAHYWENFHMRATTANENDFFLLFGDFSFGHAPFLFISKHQVLFSQEGKNQPGHPSRKLTWLIWVLGRNGWNMCLDFLGGNDKPKGAKDIIYRGSQMLLMHQRSLGSPKGWGPF